MIFSNSDPAQIVCRKQLLCRLIELMERVLSERDRSIILVRCGIEDTGPMDYDGPFCILWIKFCGGGRFSVSARGECGSRRPRRK